MAVVAGPGVDYELLGVDLERQELEFGAAPSPPTVYSQLLAIYLLQNDLCNAKFLWKRIPYSVKQSTSELSAIWQVAQKMWLKDYSAIYESLRREWSEEVKGIMAAVEESVRNRALRLVRLAYSSINADEFATFVGMSAESAIQAVIEEGWDFDQNTRIIIPKRLEPPAAPPIMNEQHLSVLTQYVTFMEN